MCTYIVFIYTFLKIKILSDKIIQHLRGLDIQIYVSVDYVIAPIQDLSITSSQPLISRHWESTILE